MSELPTFKVIVPKLSPDDRDEVLPTEFTKQECSTFSVLHVFSPGSVKRGQENVTTIRVSSGECPG